MAFETTVRTDHETSSPRHKAQTSDRTTFARNLTSMPTSFALRFDEATIGRTCAASRALAACVLGGPIDHRERAHRSVRVHEAQILSFARGIEHASDEAELLAS